MKIWIFSELILFLLFSMNVLGGTSNPQKEPSQSKKQIHNPMSKRSASLNFEDDIIEGINKNPYESLTTLNSQNNRELTKLYKKKTHFNSEIQLKVREMGISQ